MSSRLSKWFSPFNFHAFNLYILEKCSVLSLFPLFFSPCLDILRYLIVQPTLNIFNGFPKASPNF